MKKVKILFVITQGNWGGAQRYVYDLATHLDNEKFGIEVATGEKTAGELVQKLIQAKMPVHLLKNLTRGYNPIRNCLLVIELVKLIRRSSPDIVHFNSTNAGIFGPISVFIYNTLYAKSYKPKTKSIYTAHGWVFNPNNYYPTPVRWFYVWLHKIAALFQNIIINVSEYDCKLALCYSIAPVRKLVTIHNGIDSIKLASKAEARKIFPPLADNAVLIGTISQFYPTKGLRYLIDAASIVVNQNSSVIFAAVGGGPEYKNLELRIKNYGLGSKFFLLPYQENGSQYLNAFDIIAAPSLKEGLPYFLIEASLAGIPIISTSVGGIPEIIRHGENGIIVPPKNSPALAEAILELLTRKDKTMRYAINGQIHAREKFTLQKMIKETEKILEM